MKKIAIIADLPLWEVSDNPSPPQNAWHYCVWLSALCKGLENQVEYQIHWVLPKKEVTKRQVLHSRNQHFHLIPKARLTIGLYSGYLYDTIQILRELNHITPDLVHCWGTENSFSWAGSRFAGKKLLSIQGILTAYSKRARIAKFERRHALYESHTIRRFSHITTESPWAADRIRELTPAVNLHHLEYAVEERFFQIERALTSTPSCLYAGTNTPVKNVSALIEAFAAPELSRVKLLLAGVSVQDYSNLPPNILPLGPVNRGGMVKLLSETWCLVHPSLADTGPTIAKEARVAGVPVMLTSACGSKQHVDHGKSGFIVEPYDISAMRDCILCMVSSKETALAMGAHGQEACRKKLSSNTMNSELLNIYRSILD